MSFFCNCCTALTLDDFGNISNSLMAFLTLVLAFYVFVYQRNKDIALREELRQKEHSQSLHVELERKANIKMQWFKDVIIEPKIDDLFDYFDNLSSLKSKIKTTDLQEQDKIDLISFVKKEQSNLRKVFFDMLQHIEPKLYADLNDALDELTDNLTNVISEDEFKLNNPKTFEREIQNKVQHTYNFVMSKIFSYDGKMP